MQQGCLEFLKFGRTYPIVAACLALTNMSYSAALHSNSRLLQHLQMPLREYLFTL